MKIQLRSIFYWFTVISIPLFMIRDYITNEVFLGYFRFYFRFFGFKGYDYIQPTYKDTFDIAICHVLGTMCLIVSIIVSILAFLLLCIVFRSFLYPEEFEISKKE